MATSVARISMFVAALAATAAIAAPTAAADPPYGTAGVRAQYVAPDLPFIRPGTPIAKVRGLAAERHPLAPSLAADSTGFSWSAAAIGALVATVCLAMIAAVLGVRRRQAPNAV